MAAHAAVPARHHGPLGWALPVTLGVVYGVYIAFMHRDGGPLTAGDIVLGIAAGLILAALAFALGRFQRSLPREMRAGAYGALCGVAMGFLYSLTGESVLKSSGFGLIVGGALAAVTFYVFYTRE